MKVEFALLHENGSWDARTFTVPDEELQKRSDGGDDDWTLQAWAREHLAPQTQYRKIVCFALLGVVEEQ